MNTFEPERRDRSMDMVELVEQQRHYFASGKTLSVSFRIKQLRRLKFVLTQHEQELLDALKADLNKSAGEAYMTELAMVHAELNDAIHHAKRWADTFL